MSQELFINVTDYVHRVAVVEDGVLQEIYIESLQRKGLVGSIYKGKVVRILPGIESAFVDIGLEKTGFLHASDAALSDQSHSISDILEDGQSIIVQVIKDPLGNKGARLSRHLSLPGRYLVYMPNSPFFIGVSQRIQEEAEVERLKSLLQAQILASSLGGYIIRTAAEGVMSLAEDKMYLDRLWDLIQSKAKLAKQGTLLHADLPLTLRSLRDLVKPKTHRILLDNSIAYNESVTFVHDFMPNTIKKLELYKAPEPIFDRYGIEDEIEGALSRKVSLRSGGYLVFDQTEAMTTIDVNTGGFVGYHQVDDTLFQTNLEAVDTIARQIRLRNLGGMIIIDFIDMMNPDHRKQVLLALEQALANDNTKTNISDISPLGLVQMTRKRTRDSLTHQLCEVCAVCQGRGKVKSIETICHEIFRAISRVGVTSDGRMLLVLASEAVVERLLHESSDILNRFETIIKKTIKCQVENVYSQEQYDVILR
ncbi:MAG: hypothetical protein RLZ35_46 [Pseudomonadota bacterium]|jgi:ribonuclease G